MVQLWKADEEFVRFFMNNAKINKICGWVVLISGIIFALATTMAFFGGAKDIWGALSIGIVFIFLGLRMMKPGSK